MIPVFLIVLAAAFLFYANFLLRVWRGLHKLDTSRVNPTRFFLSVVIAARNEESTIEPCLNSILAQTYPSDMYEIVVVDDHSVDRTAEIAARVASADPAGRISLLSLRDHGGESGKPQAIARGIQRARGEIILCTDADCTAPPRWIESTVARFGPSVVFVAGPAFEAATNSLLQNITSLEFLSLMTTAAGLIGSGSPIICSGANIAYRKSAFEQVSGYFGNESSCDDETLMQRMIDRKAGEVVFNADPAAVVLTSAPLSLRAFWKQRTRWATKRGRYENKRILWKLIVLYAFFGLLFLAPLAVLEDSSIWPFIAGIVVIKGVLELLVLRKGAMMLGQKITPPHFLIAELLHVPYIALAALYGQFASIRWKGRTLNT